MGCRFPDNQQPQVGNSFLVLHSRFLEFMFHPFYLKFQVAPPNFFVFMLKYVMIFAVGIFSGFWVWSGKFTSNGDNV